MRHDVYLFFLHDLRPFHALMGFGSLLINFLIDDMSRTVVTESFKVERRLAMRQLQHFLRVNLFLIKSERMEIGPGKVGSLGRGQLINSYIGTELLLTFTTLLAQLTVTILTRSNVSHLHSSGEVIVLIDVIQHLFELSRVEPYIL